MLTDYCDHCGDNYPHTQLEEYGGAEGNDETWCVDCIEIDGDGTSYYQREASK